MLRTGHSYRALKTLTPRPLSIQRGAAHEVSGKVLSSTECFPAYFVRGSSGLPAEGEIFSTAESVTHRGQRSNIQRFAQSVV